MLGHTEARARANAERVLVERTQNAFCVRCTLLERTEKSGGRNAERVPRARPRGMAVESRSDASPLRQRRCDGGCRGVAGCTCLFRQVSKIGLISARRGREVTWHAKQRGTTG